MNHSLPTTLSGLLILFVAPAYGFEFEFPWLEQPATLDLTETLLTEYHDDNLDRDTGNDRYGDVRNRLNLKLSVDDFALAVRVDTAIFVGRPAASPAYRDLLRPEKITGSYTHEGTRLELGDFYASFGRGMAIRIRKTDELGEDTTLRGARWSEEVGPVEWTVLSGLTNPTNSDGITEKTLADPNDLITGLEGRWNTSERLSLGVHGVWVEYDPLRKISGFGRNETVDGMVRTGQLPERALVSGVVAELPDLYDWGNFYAELNWLYNDRFKPFADDEGFALFCAGSLLAGNWTFTGELKSYRAYQVYSQTDSGDGKYLESRIDYVRPPTLEPDNMEVDNNTDVTGARLKVDWRLGDTGTVLFASYAGFVAQDALKVGSRWIYNTQIGAEQAFLGKGLVRLGVGLREEVPDWAGGGSENLIYLDGLLRLPLAERQGLEAHGSNWWVHQNRGSGRPGVPAFFVSNYLQGEWTLGYSWSPLLSASAIWGYDTELSKRRDLDPFLESPSGGSPRRQVFLAGALTLNLSSRVILKLLGGQLRGGIKCISGACRVFPPFAGVRLETVVRL